MIRIDTVREGSLLVLRVAGSISGPDVAVLGDSVAGQGLPDRIELSGVDFLDPEGARALLALEARGVALEDPAPYVELLLRGQSPSVPKSAS